MPTEIKYSNRECKKLECRISDPIDFIIYCDKNATVQYQYRKEIVETTDNNK